MLQRTTPALALLGLLFLAACGNTASDSGEAAAALSAEPFSAERFAALQAEEALVLVDIAADWCPTCKKQHQILARYQAERPEVDLHILQVDFDQQKEWVTHFKAPRQSTLLLYRGDQQLWFSVAETRDDRIFEALDTAAGA